MHVNMERAIDDLRRGLPVLIKSDNSIRLIFSPESCSLPHVFFQHQNKYVLLSKSRAMFFLGPKAQTDVRVTVGEKTGLDAIMSLAQSNIYFYGTQHCLGDKLDASILQLLKAAGLLPCAMVVELENSESNIKTLEKELGFCMIQLMDSEVLNFHDDKSVKEACNSYITLSNEQDAKVRVFRNKGKDHLAIIIGEPGEIPLVRLHSSCYTGDILRVLTCDCGEQLRLTINMMLKAQGGILLYLNQEGRGIGLVNKLRSYRMQSLHKMDTVGANEILGFEADERDFEIATNILHKLDVTQLRLLTNNPNKINTLERNGIKVIERIRLFCTHNIHNAGYLHTKFTKLGHLDQ